MRFKGFIGPTYKLQSVNVDCQRCVNLYPEMDELGTGKEAEVGSLVGTPGLSLLVTLGVGPIRGVWYTSTDLLYVVSGNTLYKVASDWTHTTIGTLSTSTGQVGMADNGLQLVVVDGANGYYVTLADDTFHTISSVQWLGSNQVHYIDGYFFFVKPSSNETYISDLNDITFTAPANASVNGYSGNVIAFMVVNRNVWLLGDHATEVWFDSGDNNNPFQRIEGAFLEYGCAATFSIAKATNTLYWLGKDASGKGIVLLANGYTPQRISTHSVELAIQGYSDISDAVGFTYQQNGHTFYVLNFPTGNATWVYDSATQLWHERAYTNNGALDRHRANCHALAYDTHVVGDYENGKLYELSTSTYSDDGAAITRMRVSPHISEDMDRIFYSRFQLDIESGTGIDGSGQGTDPQAVLTWSNDGGHTWSNELWASFGAIGATKKRVSWNRLGQSRNRVFKLVITDPVKVTLIGAELDLMKGAS